MGSGISVWDHVKWYEKEYCEKYMEESKYIFRFVANIIAGGIG